MKQPCGENKKGLKNIDFISIIVCRHLINRQEFGEDEENTYIN